MTDDGVPPAVTKAGPLERLAGGLGWGLELRLWVALCVAGLTQFCLSVLAGSSRAIAAGIVTDHYASAIAFWSTLGLYNLDGTLDADRSSESSTLRRRLHLALTIVSAVGLAVTLMMGPARLLLIVVPGFSICALYAVQLMIFGKPTMLKKIPNMKAPFVGFAVGSAALLVPAVEVGALQRPSLSLSALWLGLCGFCTANAMLFDVPDLTVDQKQNVPTTIVQKGLLAAQRAARVWVGLGTVCALFAPATARPGLLSLAVFLMVAAGRVNPQTQKSTLAFWVDGALLLPLFLRTIVQYVP